MTDHINDKYIKVTLSMLVYVVRGLLERAPQAVFETELTCLIISIIYGSGAVCLPVITACH